MIEETKSLFENIIKYYKEGNSLLKTSVKYKISTTYVKKILKSNNVKTRNLKEACIKNTCNDNFFEKIDFKDKAYFLGLMMTDGWINKKGIGIALKDTDSYILHKYKEVLKYTGKIGKYILKNNTTMSYLILTSEKIKNDLAIYGVVQAKSHKTYFPEIPEEFHSHFIRGVFDGDGCIYIPKNKKSGISFSIVGNVILLEKIQEILLKIGFNKVILNKGSSKKENIKTLKYGGSKNCKKFYDYIYKDCEDLFLTRKKEKFEKYGK